MNRSHVWFTDRAVNIWSAAPGRSICCLVPAGCAEASHFPAFLETWLPTVFVPPPALAICRPLVIRLVPDQSTSAAKVVSRIRQKIAAAIDEAIPFDSALDPSEALDDVIRILAHHGYYLILVIERFQSFARLADLATVSLLSQLRSLEHEFSLTTILISSQTCATIRRRLPADMAFVNSAYGDNHDQAVMPILTLLEFANSAPHLDNSTAEEIFALGTGPDPVFQALIDESRVSLEGLSERAWVRSRQYLEDFVADLFGQIKEAELILLNNALHAPLNAMQIAHLKSLPLAEFLFDLRPNASHSLRGELSAKLAASLFSAPKSPPPIGMRLLFCSANPDYDLDIEGEVRAIRKVIDATAHRDRVSIELIGAVTPDDFLATLRRFQPTIIHFSGHGCPDGVIMRGDGSAEHVVTGDALAKTLQGRGIELVILNSCYSDDQATAIAPTVGTIIGTKQTLDDEAAIRFSTAFYRTLFSGETLEAAMRDGTDILALYNLDDVYACHGDLARRYI